jgi:hypothetical protein
MIEEKNNTAETAPKTTETNPKALKVSSKKSELKVPAIVWHAISGLASMGGTYLLLVKPIEELVKQIESKINMDAERIDQLEEENEQIKNLLQKVMKRPGGGGEEEREEENDYELLPTKRTKRQLPTRQHF